jgi:hypothetical protein
VSFAVRPPSVIVEKVRVSPPGEREDSGPPIDVTTAADTFISGVVAVVLSVKV